MGRIEEQAGARSLEGQMEVWRRAGGWTAPPAGVLAVGEARGSEVEKRS